MTVDGEQTRGRLLAQARDLYLSEGLSKVSLREVARRCRVSPAAVYRHFDGRDALLREVCAQGFRIFSSYLMRALAAPSPRERMLESGRHYLAFGTENPRDYRIMFMAGAEELGSVMPSGGPEASPTFRFLVDRVQECMQAKVIKKAPPGPVAATIWAHVHGLVSLRLTGQLAAIGDDRAFARFFAHSNERLLEGLAA